LLKSFKTGDSSSEADKVRDALKTLEAFGGSEGMEVVVENTDDLPLSEVDDEIGREISDAPDIIMPIKRHRSEQSDVNTSAQEVSTVISSSSATEKLPSKTETLLSAELGFFSDSAPEVRMIRLQAFENPSLERQFKTLDDTNRFDCCSTVELSCLDTPLSVYSDVAFTYLKRLLESYSEMKDLGHIMLNAHLKLCLRTTLAMSKIYIFENKPMSNIPIIVSTSAIIDGFPPNVEIPRPLWLYISFVLSLDIPKKLNTTVSGDIITPHEHLLVELTSELYRRGGASPLYESTVLVIISRLLQKTKLRILAKPFLLSLPKVSDELMSLLKLIAETGSRAEVGKVSLFNSRLVYFMILILLK